jgi:Zn-finger nucleic acid-binding protein
VFDIYVVAKTYEINLCPRCGEDYLAVAKNNVTASLYLYCSECEASWLDPREIDQRDQMFVDPNMDASDATEEEIRAYGWWSYVSRVVESKC